MRNRDRRSKEPEYDRGMGHLVWIFAVSALVSSCTKKNPVLVCSNGTCSDPAYPYCDRDGAVAGDPNACIAVSCAPGAFAACDGDDVITCDANGTNYDSKHCINGCSVDAGGCNPCQPNMSVCQSNGVLDTCDSQGQDTSIQCAAGCLDTPQPHCASIQPFFLPDACELPAQTAFDVTSDRTIDTSVEISCPGGTVPQGSGPDICVARYTSMSVAAGVKLRVTRSGADTDARNRPIAFVVDDDLDIAGTLDASAGAIGPAPGGGYTSAGGDTFMGGGLGGAGFATPGGSGGDFQSDGGKQNGGAQLPNPLTSSVFLGGARNFAEGGGAVMLVSCRGTVRISGAVHVGGGGGLGGSANGIICLPGAGGGAGGNVLIEGMNVDITGSLYANGGGGGAGCVPNTQATSEQNGADGPMSDVVSGIGGVAVNGGGSGGNGGIGTTPPGDGRHAQMGVGQPGGGGGSVGWLQVATPSGVTPTLTPSHVSPPLQSATANVR